MTAALATRPCHSAYRRWTNLGRSGPLPPATIRSLTRYVIAGHLHPVLSLRGIGRDRLRLPCFSFEARCAVLPAFGEFTGGWLLQRQAARTLYAVGGQTVWRVPDVG